MNRSADGWLVADSPEPRRRLRSGGGPRKENPETPLVRSVIKLLHALGCPAWRNNTGVMKAQNEDGSERFIRFGIPGMPDVSGLIPPIGRMIAIECKVGRNPLSEDQDRVLRDFGDAGALTAVVRDTTQGLAELIREAIDEARKSRRPIDCANSKRASH